MKPNWWILIEIFELFILSGAMIYSAQQMSSVAEGKIVEVLFWAAILLVVWLPKFGKSLRYIINNLQSTKKEG